MPIRTAIRQSTILTSGLLLVGLWTVVQLLNVVELTESFLALGVPIVSTGSPVGRLGAAGVLGALVLLVFLGLLVVLLGELGETEPAPETFPPEE